MPLATPNSRAEWANPKAGLVAFLAFAPALFAWGAEPDPAALTRQEFQHARKEYQSQPQNPEAAWHFARATFDEGDWATNNSERAEIAQQGIAACKQALVNASNSAPLHYYLGLNQGQLARTRSLGAPQLVNQLEM